MTGRREHDAVREARDALVIVAAAIPVVAVVAGLIGVAAGDPVGWARWLAGSVVVAALLLGTLAAALLLTDRAGHRILGTRPHAIGRWPLVAGSLAVGAVLIAGTPTTWPIVIGFGIVCLALGAVIVIGAIFNF